MKAELLLQWASERGSGSWHEWVSATRWGSDHDAGFAPQQLMRTLSTLGHLEIDWATHTWAVAPTIITLLPNAGGHGFLTGARTGALTRRLQGEIAEDLEVFIWLQPQSDGPDACLIAADGDGELQKLAEWLGVDFEFSVSERLLTTLPDIDAMLAKRRSTPGVPDFGVRRWDPYRSWRLADRDDAPGLYEYEHAGRRELRWISDAMEIFRVDLPLGVYAELRRAGRCEDVLKWWGKSINGDLGVPLWAPAPNLHARAAALCSGVAPLRRGKVTLYKNVPLPFAQDLAASLGQNLVAYEG
jgi:hypothetical protein